MSTFTGGCDPWGVPCPTHGADHWRNATDRLTAERDAAVARAEAAEAAVERVRAVHGPWEALRNIKLCRNCGTYLPCATIRALDGGEAA